MIAARPCFEPLQLILQADSPLVIIACHLGTVEDALNGFDGAISVPVPFCSVLRRHRRSIVECRLGTENLFFWLRVALSRIATVSTRWWVVGRSALQL
jgi:hypothetical protein